MNSEHLGWRSFFADQLDSMAPQPCHYGRIANVQKGNYLIYSSLGEHWAKLAGNYSYHQKGGNDLPVVGDWVHFTWQPGDTVAIIHSRFQRQTCIKRASAGSRHEQPSANKEEQVIAANVDIAFITSGLDRDYNLRRLERYLTLVYDCGVTPVIILNKADLCDEPDQVQLEVESIALGVPVFLISAETRFDPAPFHRFLTPGKTAVLLGSSGVGKSTIINKLLAEERQTVNEVSLQVGKGTHTTTTRELFALPEHGLIIDTPGMRELQLLSPAKGLESSFNDIEALAEGCRFSDCRHENEPGCGVKRAVEEGSLKSGRFVNYLKLRKELMFISDRQSKSLKLIEKEKTRKIKILQRQMKKIKRGKG